MMALIDTVGQKLVLTQPNAFVVKPPLKWVECADDVRHWTHKWDGSKIIPGP